MMKVVFSFLLLTIANSCNNTIAVKSGSLDCIYVVACKNPRFISCEVSYKNMTTLLYYSQDSCSQFCCKQSLLFCPILLVKPQESSISIALVGSILAILIAIGILLICFYKFNEECSFILQRFCCCYKKNTVTTIDLRISNHHLTQDQTQLNIELEAEGWKRTSEHLTQGQCPVCLCQGPNLMLDCGHLFHRECIRECLKRKYECVLCRSKDLSIFKLFCNKCGMKYMEVHALSILRGRSRASECTSCCTIQILA